MFFRSCPILRLIRGPVDGGSTSSRGQESLRLLRARSAFGIRLCLGSGQVEKHVLTILLCKADVRSLIS